MRALRELYLYSALAASWVYTASQKFPLNAFERNSAALKSSLRAILTLKSRFFFNFGAGI
jgi:hypothetical protein